MQQQGKKYWQRSTYLFLSATFRSPGLCSSVQSYFFMLPYLPWYISSHCKDWSAICYIFISSTMHPSRNDLNCPTITINSIGCHKMTRHWCLQVKGKASHQLRWEHCPSMSPLLMLPLFALLHGCNSDCGKWPTTQKSIFLIHFDTFFLVHVNKPWNWFSWVVMGSKNTKWVICDQ